MGVKQTKYGTWQVRWRDVNGRQRAAAFRTRALAEKHERKVRSDTERGLPTAKRERITLAALADQWLDSAHNLDERSVKIYREALAHIVPVLGEDQVAAIGSDKINAYLAGRRGKAASSSVHREYRTLRRLLRVAVPRYIAASPITRDTVPAPRVPHEEMTFLSAVELERLAGAIDARYRSLILVAGWGGLRWGELAGLRPGDVDVAAARVHVVGQLSTNGKRWKPETKTKVRRWVSIPRSVADELVLPLNGYVWTQPGGGPIEHTKFRQRFFVPAAVRASLATMVSDVRTRRSHYEGVTMHDLRHTAVALAISAGANQKEIQALCGHTTIGTTFDRYGHLFPDAQADLAARMEQLRRGIQSTADS